MWYQFAAPLQTLGGNSFCNEDIRLYMKRDRVAVSTSRNGRTPGSIHTRTDRGRQADANIHDVAYHTPWYITSPMLLSTCFFPKMHDINENRLGLALSFVTKQINRPVRMKISILGGGMVSCVMITYDSIGTSETGTPKVCTQSV